MTALAQRFSQLPRRHKLALAFLATASFLLAPAARVEAATAGGGNLPPNCSGAAPSQAVLWPPTQGFRAVAITGVTDPDGDPVTIQVIGITQDEPSTGSGGGDACPDGMIGADGGAQVRLERNSSGNGRVYRIQFVATDAQGATCTGAVTVCVPKTFGRASRCADDGQTVNSLAPCPGAPGPSPVPIIDACNCTAGGSTKQVTDTFDPNRAPRDTCPANSRIDIQWHAEPPTASGYAYRLDEPQFVEVGPSVTSVTYPSPVAPGTKVFTLRALDQALGAIETTRYFQLNFRPDSWIAGPDPDVAGPPWVTKPNGEKYALLVNGAPPPGGLPGTLVSDDSVEVLPADRVERRTFLEIYRDTAFIRRELDTVHLGSWVVFHNGGADSDSRYRVKVADDIESTMPSFPGGVVLTPAAENGSPIGFRTRVVTFLTPNGPPSFTAQSGLYPFFDPNDVLHFPRIAAYHPMLRSGKAYSVQRAEDGDGARDDRIALGDERSIGESPSNPLRTKVLVFEVNFPPQLRTSDPTFRPRLDRVDTLYSQIWNLELPASDRDPYAPGDPPGGPSGSQTLRLRLKVTGTDLGGDPLVFLDPAPGESQQKYVNTSQVNLVVPAALASGPATLTVELCDCAFCEVNPGSGRCITQDIPVHYAGATLSGGSSRPASAAAPVRSRSEAARAMPTALLPPGLDPARGEVTIRFSLAAESAADLDLYDVTGQRVRHLATGRSPAGEHARVWNGEDERGRPVAAGVYFARLRTEGATLTRKFFLPR